MTKTHYELRWITPGSPRGAPLHEGIGIVNDPLRYEGIRGARAGIRHMERDGTTPAGAGRVAVIRVTEEEIDEEPVVRKTALPATGATEDVAV